MSQYNENAVIHALRVLGPSSQGDLAAYTGLSVPAVSTIVRNLSRHGYLSRVRTESVGRGRPRAIVGLNPSARFAAGLHIDPAIMTAVVLDLTGQVVSCETSDAIDPNDAAASLDAAANLVSLMIAGSGIDPKKLLGACAALPGPLDDTSDSLVATTWLPAWAGIPIGDGLTRRLGTPVPIIKDTLAAVTGEAWVRGGPSLESTMVFVYLGTGTGVGLSINGEPIRGASGNAGEVGRMLVSLGKASMRGMDNDPLNLVLAAHEAGLLSAPPPTRNNLRDVPRQLRRLCELAHNGDAAAADILIQAGGRIAEMVLMTCEVFDADTVVCGGPDWELLRPFYEPAMRTSVARPSARGPHPIEVLSTAMGPEVGAIGAASFVLDTRFAPRLGH